MAGITSFAYRDFMSQFGFAFCYSEMISDCGLIYGNKETFNLLYSKPINYFYGIQLFGGTKENLLKALKILDERKVDYDFIDINFGCPVPKVTRNNGGSAWLKDVDKLYECAKCLVSNCSKPITAKIRLGWDDNSINVYEVCKKLEEAGVSLIAIHARTKKQGYSGTADYSKLNEIKNIINIPVVISGDIFTYEDAIKALNDTKADGVMVARGGVGNPKLIKEINDYETGKNVTYVRTFDEQKKYLIDFMDRLIEEKGEELAMRLLRGIAPKFFSSFPNSKRIRNQLSNNIERRSDVISILETKYDENNGIIE